jgi:hypothetical protein
MPFCVGESAYWGIAEIKGADRAGWTAAFEVTFLQLAHATI